MEEITDHEISTKSATTQVYIPHILFQEATMQPTKLQEHVETDGLDSVVQNKSGFDDSHDQILSTQTILDTGQAIDKTVLVAEIKKPTVEPIEFQECRGQFYEYAKFYKGKHEALNDNAILRQEIRRVQKLWVLNTRFKSARPKHKPIWEGPYLITKSHSTQKGGHQGFNQ
ncbi:hypothetical protein ACFX1Q_039751 [Malus domestica]